MTHFDTVIVGAGPGGYVAAIRAAQLGQRTAIVEKQWWGGVCLNVGCIPTKALLRNAELVTTLKREAGQFGISGDFTYDYRAAFQRSRAVSDRMVKGVNFLMRKNKITQYHGWGTFRDARTLSVRGDDGVAETLTYDNCIIAAGATAKGLPGVTLGERVVTYQELITADTLPESIVICGAGAIGMEFAYILSAYGVKVTVVEFLQRVLPLEDPEVSSEVAKAYKALGIAVLTGHAVQSIAETATGVAVHVAPAGGESFTLEADKVLVAVGFLPRTIGYGLETTGVALTDRGAIAIDDRMRTSVPGLYAIGDVTGKLMLAHTAEAQGTVAAEAIAGGTPLPIDYAMVPRATYCNPAVAAFGYTEAQARELGFDPVVAKFPFTANGKAWGMGESVGFVKLVADSKHHELLGAHMVGAGVTELLPELTLAQKWDLTADEIALTIHAHPTLSEAIREAAEGIGGRMTNL